MNNTPAPLLRKGCTVRLADGRAATVAACSKKGVLTLRLEGGGLLFSHVDVVTVITSEKSGHANQ